MPVSWPRALLGIAVILALGMSGGLIGSAMVAGRAYTDRADREQRAERVLTVTGSARKRIQSDLATWRVSISSRGVDMPGAYAALDAAAAKVLAFLKKRQFAVDEMVWNPIEMETFFRRDKEGYATREITEYGLSRDVVVTTGRLEDIGMASSEVTELLQDGIAIQSYPPRYLYTKIADLKVEMIGEATKDARARAEQIARNAGCRLGDVRGARMGVLQITRPNSTDVSDSGVYDTSTIEKDVTSVIGLTIQLAP